ncbi:HdaA/DnaA family protein [Sphingomonas abietis]|uniref:Chromosomal replication initiator DnaA n=1 Tax=Sphingomonas abietis TaxID=3012344 RepID=A0ABY7NT92_9SPHN|nr:chromosomal replication initiator DnaA [Sphingomonas abietis]WBO24155.1 chromosomal replication initiator DnaA [Sphingomonas abietis]
MSQIALPLDWPEDERDDQFILSDANAAVARHLEHWALWPVPVTILTGPRKSGRSLIGRLFARKTGGRLFDNAWAADEEALFHAWNGAMASHRPLLIVADAAPPAWQVTLPDLASRLVATPRVAILPPDDMLLRALLERGLARRGLAVPPPLVTWLSARIERSYVGIIAAIDALDRASLSRQHRLTVPLAREALEQAGVIDAS